MAEITLFEAREKLRWAEKHFDALWREIKPFEERDDHTIDLNVNRETGEYVFRVWNLPTPDPDWGLRIGDCLHNARTALDYVMVRLYALATDHDPRDIEAIQFPVCDTRDRWNGSPAVQKFRKEPTLSGYLTRVEEMQPFNDNNPSIWGNRDSIFPNDAFLPMFLEKLSRWDNIDKHRVVHAAWLGAAQYYAPTQAPKSYGHARQTRHPGPFKNGAEIARWEFAAVPLPAEPWEPSEVDMKRQFPLEVAIDEPLPSKGVLWALPLCFWAVKAVLHIFEPVFAEGAPSLPVTVSNAVPAWKPHLAEAESR